MFKKLVDLTKNYWYNYKLYRYLKQEEQVLAGLKITGLKLNITREHSLYIEGISKIKKVINSKASTKEEYEQVLQETQELSQHAIRYNDANGLAMIENLKKAWVYKNEVPKEKMIDDRIKAMYQLQADKLKRQELRNKRKQNNGNKV